MDPYHEVACRRAKEVLATDFSDGFAAGVTEAYVHNKAISASAVGGGESFGELSVLKLDWRDCLAAERAERPFPLPGGRAKFDVLVGSDIVYNAATCSAPLAAAIEAFLAPGCPAIITARDGRCGFAEFLHIMTQVRGYNVEREVPFASADFESGDESYTYKLYVMRKKGVVK